MKIQTKFFGEMNINEEDIVRFPKGVIGFEDMTEFIIIESPEEGIPFQYMQSVEEPKLSFVIMNPFVFKKDYEFDIPDSTQKFLELKLISDVMLYTIVVIPKDVNKMTANLAAPLIINVNKKIGKQIILEDKNYPVKFSVLKSIKEQKQEVK